MQIHELNEYPLNPSEGDWLIVDTGKDTAKVGGERFAYKTDVDVLSKEVSKVVINNNGYRIDTLWTGSMYAGGDSAALTNPIANYDYIDIYTYFLGATQIYTTEAVTGDLFIRNQNIADETSSNFLVVGELKLVLSAQAVGLEFNHRWRWSGSSSASATMTSNDSEMRITKIVGRKCVVNQVDTEVEDIRVGADGTVYNSAGEAVRDQVGDLDTRLSRYETIFTADVDQSVSNWLDEHPEATTTVQDGSITETKLADRSVVTDKLADSAVTDAKINTVLGLSRPDVRVIYNEQTIPTLTGDTTHAHMQGSAFISSKGHWLVAFRTSDSSSVMLVEVGTDFETVYGRYVLDLGHANSMTYNQNNDRLYVTTMAQGGNANSIVEVDPSDMSITNKYSVNSPYAVAYDYDRNLYYVGYGSGSNVAVYDSSFSLVREIQIDKSQIYAGTDTVTTQDMTYYNDHILWLCGTYNESHTGYIISAVNLESGNVVSREYYTVYDGSEEAESLTIVDGIGYIFAGNKYFRVSNFSFKKALNLSINAFAIGTRLDQGTDLNDVLVYGKYYSSSGAVTGTMENVPLLTNQGFTMFVLQHVFYNILQIVIANSYDIYIRRYDANGRFYPWRSILGAQKYTATTTHTINNEILRRQGDMVAFNCTLVTSSSVSSGGVIATLPEGCRPPGQITFGAYAGDGSTVLLQIETNGQINVLQAVSASTTIYISVTFPNIGIS